MVAGVLAAVFGVGVWASAGPASADSATPTVSFRVEASVEPGGDEFHELAVDRTTRRVFTLDVRNSSVQIYQLGSSGLLDVGEIRIRGIGTGPTMLAVNEFEHEVYLISRGASEDELLVVDVDPASATTGTITSRWSARGRSFDVGVDPSTHRVALLNSGSPQVVVIDLDDGARQEVDLGTQVESLVVDPASHVVYAPSSTSSSVLAVRPDGSFTSSPLPHRPAALAVGGGRVVVATEGPAMRLEVYDAATLQLLASSKPLRDAPADMIVDAERQAIFAGYGGLASGGVEAFRLGDAMALGASEASSFGDLEFAGPAGELIAMRNGLTPKITVLQANFDPLPRVDRIGGADRFAVAAAVSRDTFVAAPVAYVASGEVFADALSGAAAAGLQGGPVLLVTRDGVPAATVEELRRLRPGRIVVLGGPAAVSDVVEKALGEFGTVSRIGGPDRFAVSAAVSAKEFPDGATYAYLASGETFPDALSASPLAGREKGPMLLTQKGALPSAVAAEIGRLKAQYVYVLGGEQAVSAAVVAEVTKQAAVIRIDGPDRFAVSAAASARSFRPHTYTVYVASGQAFPDALAGGPAAIIGGSPVLLVTKDGIPAPVAAELKRLAPYRIVLLGGPNAVSETVKSQLESYLPD
ncbi:cell wall-binding repeat-containing protein [Herbiconiux sp. VKM Ac-2851]|uniref:cell wall-binding repeat-containing protein n=1 Tax=Herbiconiux sp. VKM Ac-2851 TaxID=2739025 RepID=UPI001565F2A5|nr:cell wall-binding repeat-containing protein [Herbiconiux sp. VKM Ac-2851]NQX36534.1 cell wall-binding repeat-containing protein [Herbiconiux sp. VKM Ac-2851]